MANASINLDDLNAFLGLVAAGTADLSQQALNLYNTGRTKAGKTTASSPQVVDITPTAPSATLHLPPQVYARIQTAINAAV